MLSNAVSGLRWFLGLGKSSTSTEDERRLWGRISCDIETTCEQANTPGSQRLPARVRNISRGGINLSMAQAFEPGELLSVALPVGGETEVLACVVRCEPRDGSWDLGCTFAAQLNDDDLRHFGAKREKAVPPDQRAWVRYPCQATATYQQVRATGGPGVGTATVLNLSASGIALQVSETLHVGELLSLELSRDGEVRLTTLASVVRTGSAPESGRLIGCNFISELSEEQVLTLL